MRHSTRGDVKNVFGYLAGHDVPVITLGKGDKDIRVFMPAFLSIHRQCRCQRGPFPRKTPANGGSCRYQYQ